MTLFTVAIFRQPIHTLNIEPRTAPIPARTGNQSPLSDVLKLATSFVYRPTESRDRYPNFKHDPVHAAGSAAGIWRHPNLVSDTTVTTSISSDLSSVHATDPTGGARRTSNNRIIRLESGQYHNRCRGSSFPISFCVHGIDTGYIVMSVFSVYVNLWVVFAQSVRYYGGQEAGTGDDKG